MASESQQLRFSRCEVHFIYSFLVDLQSRFPFEGKDKPKDEPLVGDNSEQLPPIKRLYKALEKSTPTREWKEIKPDIRIGVASNLFLRGIDWGIYWTNEHEPAEFVLQTTDGQEQATDRQKTGEMLLKLTEFVRINDSGASTITLTVTVVPEKDGITAIDVHKIYGLIGANVLTPPLYRLSKKTGEPLPSPKTLFDFFWELVKEIGSATSTGDATYDQEHRLILDEHAKPKREGVEWQNPFVPKRADVEWQNPSVLTKLALMGKFGDEDKRKDPPWVYGRLSGGKEDLPEARAPTAYQELITLWARFLKGKKMLEDGDHRFVRTQSVDEPAYSLMNYSWHKDVFIGYHGRGGTVIHYPAPRDSADYPEPRKSAIVKDLTESYLDLLETLRARWHLCVLFGELISKDLDYLITLKDDELFDFTKTIIKRREMFIRFLADPTMHAFEGGVVSEICRKARNDLYIDTLTSAVKEKFSALEKYYRERIDIRIRDRLR